MAGPYKFATFWEWLAIYRVHGVIIKWHLGAQRFFPRDLSLWQGLRGSCPTKTYHQKKLRWSNHHLRSLKLRAKAAKKWWKRDLLSFRFGVSAYFLKKPVSRRFVLGSFVPASPVWNLHTSHPPLFVPSKRSRRHWFGAISRSFAIVCFLWQKSSGPFFLLNWSSIVEKTTNKLSPCSFCFTLKQRCQLLKIKRDSRDSQ